MGMTSDYWNALDQGKKMRVDPEQIGISHGVGDVGEGLKANVFRGAKTVELGFMGTGKGSRAQPGGHTPESYGNRERQEMRELAKINEVDVSTHASPNVGFAAGYDPQGQMFRPELQQNVLHEVQRAIEFAGDVGGGGPVVMHLGEFPRPLFDVEKNQDGSPKFEQFKKESERAPIYVVDDRTGRVQALRRDVSVDVPIPKVKGVSDPWDDPLRNKETGLIEFEKKRISDYEQEALKKGVDPAKYVFEELMKKEVRLNKGEELRWTIVGDGGKRTHEDFQRHVQEFKDMRKTDPRRAHWEAIKFGRTLGGRSSIPPPDSPKHEEFTKDPFTFLEKEGALLKQDADSHYELARSYAARRIETQGQIEHTVPIIEYGKKKSADTISDAAMHAYTVEKDKNLKKPLFISPENWAPDSYGSHPQEYRDVIVASREAMAEKLQDKGMGSAEAKKVAEDHIKGTFDVAHANFMQKFFKGSKKDFDKWLTKETDKLAKDGIIGNVHLSDNFGYFDEHLAPGEGNVPIQRFVEGLKKHGYKGRFIAEPGGQREGRFHQPLTETWKVLGSPMYRIDGTSQSWTDVESSYFGRSQPPNFVVGDYAPSKDWTLWSEVPLE
jgi:sugar phosphate isomerase/epimerase